LFARGERKAVDGTRPVLFEHCKVEARAVAFVAIKAVQGIFFVESEHEPVTRNFGNDGRCHALENGGICFHDRFLRYGKVKKKVSINN
jgi:hypothetical protein